jgi:UDP:flavonoid glycosyltransferase YjiC (YdhE family)
VRLFISHSGQNSILESTINGVPILTIPLFFDQIRNANCAKNRGHARILTKDDLLNEEKLREEIAEMLENQR